MKRIAIVLLGISLFLFLSDSNTQQALMLFTIAGVVPGTAVVVPPFIMLVLLGGILLGMSLLWVRKQKVPTQLTKKLKTAVRTKTGKQARKTPKRRLSRQTA